VDSAALICRMEILPGALPALVANISAADASWRPPSGAWSIVEIVNHLIDEDTRDFRARLELTLCDPPRQWPPIDPEGWAQRDGYNERDLMESVSRFVSVRGESLQWLRWLRGPDWSLEHHHPRFGSISAGELLGAWVAHDCLHMRQIAKRLYELCERDALPHPVRYAGEWRA
jgi:hypothetical protein